MKLEGEHAEFRKPELHHYILFKIFLFPYNIVMSLLKKHEAPKQKLS